MPTHAHCPCAGFNHPQWLAPCTVARVRLDASCSGEPPLRLAIAFAALLAGFASSAEGPAATGQSLDDAATLLLLRRSWARELVEEALQPQPGEGAGQGPAGTLDGSMLEYVLERMETTWPELAKETCEARLPSDRNRPGYPDYDACEDRVRVTTISLLFHRVTPFARCIAELDAARHYHRRADVPDWAELPAHWDSYPYYDRETFIRSLWQHLEHPDLMVNWAVRGCPFRSCDIGWQGRGQQCFKYDSNDDRWAGLWFESPTEERREECRIVSKCWDLLRQEVGSLGVQYPCERRPGGCVDTTKPCAIRYCLD